MITPPRTVELLLGSLGADANFRDSVIGDLAEEFAQRTERDGAADARWWYYREAVRATPHLLRNWARNAGVAGAWHVAGVVVSTYVIVLITAGLGVMAICSVVAAVFKIPNAAAMTGGIVGTQHFPWNNTTAFALLAIGIVGLDVGIGMFGGYVAAYLNAAAPLATATILGAAWTIIPVATLRAVAARDVVTNRAISVDHFPLWFRFLAAFAVFLGAVAGGVLRVRGSAPLLDEDHEIAGA